MLSSYKSERNNCLSSLYASNIFCGECFIRLSHHLDNCIDVIRNFENTLRGIIQMLIMFVLYIYL